MYLSGENWILVLIALEMSGVKDLIQLKNEEKLNEWMNEISFKKNT